jgi:outer membrane receptor protein involved in Fe transport
MLIRTPLLPMVFTCAALAAGPGHATTIDEIVVTSERRAQSSREVAASISALDGARIAAVNARHAHEIAGRQHERRRLALRLRRLPSHPPADRSDRFTDVAPHLALDWSVASGTNLYLRLARGFRAPQTTELYFDRVAAQGETFVAGREVDTAPRGLGAVEFRPSGTTGTSPAAAASFLSS